MVTNPYLEKIAAAALANPGDVAAPAASTPTPPKSTFMHALGTEGTAIAAGLLFKKVGAKALGVGRIGAALEKSKIGQFASRHIWDMKPGVSVGGKVLAGEVGEYTGSIGGVYGALKYKDHVDNKKAQAVSTTQAPSNSFIQKAASLQSQAVSPEVFNTH